MAAPPAVSAQVVPSRHEKPQQQPRPAVSSEPPARPASAAPFVGGGVPVPASAAGQPRQQQQPQQQQQQQQGHVAAPSLSSLWNSSSALADLPSGFAPQQQLGQGQGRQPVGKQAQQQQGQGQGQGPQGQQLQQQGGKQKPGGKKGQGQQPPSSATITASLSNHISTSTMPPNFAFSQASAAAAVPPVVQPAAAPKPAPEDPSARVARLRRAWEAESTRDGPRRSEQVCRGNSSIGE